MIQIIINLFLASHSVNVAFSHLIYLAYLLEQRFFALNYQYEEIKKWTYLLFVLVSVHLSVTKIFNFLFAHQIMLHSAL